ncbi:hypothetical protein [Geminisphaera colitermitum]|uniref:hypothetical protein n=1 Tax=Geminisphaera colitermitum TaxID=1148786 RepID=UPI000158CBA9|nr:hypothetical protein [Geminisphaera colitermitum]
MPAATSAINTDFRLGDEFAYPVAAATKIWLGTLVALDATGRAVPAANTAALKVAGVSQQDIDNSDGAAGDQLVNLRRGVHKFANSATAPLTVADLLTVALVEDDCTVTKTATNNIKAGRVLAIDADGGIWIDTRDT